MRTPGDVAATWTRHVRTSRRGRMAATPWPAPAGSRPGGYVATPGRLATTPVNAARANGGTRGREWRHLPDRGQAATSATPGPHGHNARERDTGERRDGGAGNAIGQTCRIAASG